MTLDLDDLQESIGGLSSYQLWVLIGAASLIMASGFTSQTGVIYSAQLAHRCAVPPIDDPSVYPDLTEEEIRNLTIPLEDGEYSSCQRYNYDLSTCTGGDDFSCITGPEAGTVKCEGYWYNTTYYEDNTITDWDLVCDRITLDSMANSLFFFGWFIGSFTFGPLSDWFGRKRACLVYAISLCISSTIIAFVPWFPLYVIMRIIVGGSVNEIMTHQTRLIAAAYIPMISSISHVILPGVGYVLRNWRYVSLFNAALCLPYLCVFSFFLPRSPSVQNYDEAKRFMKRCAESNKSPFTDEEWEEVVKEEKKKALEAVGNRYTIADLFKRPFTRVVSINVAYCWFVVSMVFYGLTLNGGNLAGKPYLNTTMNAIMEVLAVFAYYATGGFGRVRMLSIGFFGAGACCLLSMGFELAAPDDESGLMTAAVVLAIIGKFFSSFSFNFVYSVAAEAYPTPVRATGLSLGSMAARIGGMITPFTLQLQYKNAWITQAIFGILSLIASMTSLLYPETKDAEFITTLDEAESFYSRNMNFTRKYLGVKPAVSEVTHSKSNPMFESIEDEETKESIETKL